MATERVLSNLNLISFKTESGLQNHIDELQDGDLVFTPDNSLKGTLLDYKWADHILNDMSWLRADTFSWHSGDVYVAAYNHLVADFEGTTAETETIGDIEITYYRAEDKHKICLPDQEDKVLALYNATGVAWYYILDTENKQFKLPRSKHNKYADTVPVVGNGMALGVTTGSLDRALGSATVHDSATVNALMVSNTDPEGVRVGNAVSVPNQGNSLGTGIAYGISTTPEKSGLIALQEQDTDQYKYLYFYVGNFERDAVEQTAGVTTEMFNSKADSDLKNIPANYDYVVESQMPTEANGYTWYRKYKSGWVEQGGTLLGTDSYVTTVFPVEFTNDKYTLFCINHQNVATAWSNRFGFDKTTTGFTWVSNSNIPEDWQASGMSAQ